MLGKIEKKGAPGFIKFTTAACLNSNVSNNNNQPMKYFANTFFRSFEFFFFFAPSLSLSHSLSAVSSQITARFSSYFIHQCDFVRFRFCQCQWAKEARTGVYKSINWTKKNCAISSVRWFFIRSCFFVERKRVHSIHGKRQFRTSEIREHTAHAARNETSGRFRANFNYQRWLFSILFGRFAAHRS